LMHTDVAMPGKFEERVQVMLKDEDSNTSSYCIEAVNEKINRRIDKQMRNEYVVSKDNSIVDGL
ncbi:hypothetical protein U1Q18_010249, partial [Sarracenia purpurea var. burkii]